LIGQIAKADSAQAELAIDGAGPAADFAAPFTAHGKLRLAIRLGDFGFFGHGKNL
jgi:hypothetical protein